MPPTPTFNEGFRWGLAGRGGSVSEQVLQKEVTTGWNWLVSPGSQAAGGQSCGPCHGENTLSTPKSGKNAQCLKH